MGISRKNYELFFIDYLDGEMSPEQVVELMDFLKKNPVLKEELNEFELYKKTRLIPENIVFEYKSILKKKSVIRIPSRRVWGYISAAASIIIFVMFYFFARQPANTEKLQFAEKQSDTTSIEIRVQEDESIRDNEIANLKKRPEMKLPVKKIIESEVTEHLIYNKPVESDTVRQDTKKIHLEKVTRKGINPLPEKPLLATLIIIQDFEVGETSRDNLTLSQMIIKTFKIRVLEENEYAVDFNNLSLWDIADAGIRGINKIIGWEMEFSKKYSEEGELIALAFDSNTISFSHTMNK